jgi:hypothetical protein
MKTKLLTTLALLGAAACGGGSEAAKADSTQRDLAMAPVDSSAALNDQPAAAAPTTPAPATNKPANRPQPPAPVPSQLASGTEFAAAAVDSITSRKNKPGETMRVRVTDGVKDPQGRVVIPAGAVISLRIDTLAPAENDKDKTGKLKLTPTAVEIGGASYPIAARVDSVAYSIVGRGVTAGDAAKVGAGAAAGAVAGRVIGGNTRGAVVGGVVGAAAGTAVASQTNDRDVVIRTGNYIRIELTGAFRQ